jgi:hypothetical protein
LNTVLVVITFALALLAGTSPPPQSITPITGVWAGPLIVTVDGKPQEEYLHVVLKQAGDVVTGTAGENADQQFPIRNGKLTTVRDVTTLTFEFIANGVHFSFNLKPNDGLIKGDVRIVGEDGHAYVAKAELKPVKYTGRELF